MVRLGGPLKLCARGRYELEGDGDGVVRVLARWGSLSCGLFECGGRLGRTRRRRSAGCGPVLLLPFGLCPAVSAAAALPFSRMLYSFRLWPIAVRAAMPILHCARDRVTCAARVWQRGSSVCGRERGTAALVRGNTACRCVVVVCERGKVGRLV